MQISRKALALVLVAAVAVGAGAVLLVLQLNAGGDSASERSARSARPATAAERFEPDSTKLADCTDSSLKCLEQAMGNMAYEQGAEPALKLLEGKVGTGGPLDASCHRLTHAVGYGTLRRVDGDVGAAFVQGSSTCSSGYFHGVLERAFAGVPDAELESVATGLCASDEVRTSRYLHFQCVHGLGHGLMLHTAYDLPAALEVCKAFTDPWESTSCDSGVFMENIAASRGATSRYLKDDDLIYPCNDIAERHKMYCYLMVTSRIIQVNGADWPATARLCSTKAEVGWRDECFQSYGRDASGQAVSGIEPIVETCRIAGPKWHGDCVYGAARDIVNEDAAPARGARFCTLLSADRDRCAEGVGTLVADLRAVEAERAAWCRSSFAKAGAEPALVKSCLVGARVDSA